MTVLALKRPIPPPLRLDMHGVVPCRFAPGLESLATIEIGVDQRREPLNDWFTASDDGSQELSMCGQLERCDRLAGGMLSGRMRIMSHVGDQLAQAMRGGQVFVEGNAGRFAASGLRGGQVTIHGNVGDYAAGAVPGQACGMRGGVLLIEGSCHRWLAARMRRGTVIVTGAIGGGCASRMIAGTVVLCGTAESPLGAGMRRGSILFIKQRPTETLPGFTTAEDCELSYLAIQMQELSAYIGDRLPNFRAPLRVLRSMGDRTEAGLGELIWIG